MGAKNVMIGFKTDIETKERLDEMANREDRSISYIVNRIVKEALAAEAQTEGERALKAVEYIDNLKFSTYEEFVNIAVRENKYKALLADLGELQMYMIICERLGIKPKQEYLDTLRQ